MSIDLAKQLSVRIEFNGRKSSGVIYHGFSNNYVITAKHAVCKNDSKDCFNNKRIVCENCKRGNTTKSKIKIDKPDVVNSSILKVKDFIFCDDKDIAILVLKDEENNIIKSLPKIEIIMPDDIDLNSELVTCGYPSISNYNFQPILYSSFQPINKKFFLNIKSDTITNFNSPQDNLSGNSGAGIFKYNNEIAKLIGIYTETGDMGGGYGEIIDESINQLLKNKGYQELKFGNKIDILKTQIQNSFKSCFNPILHDINFSEKRKLNLYRLALDGKKYNYNLLIDKLLEFIPYFTLSRKYIKNASDNGENVKLIRDSLRSFKAIETEEKIPEVILHGFLEAYMSAPRLYSSHQNNNSIFQGAHIRFKDGRNTIEIIHCIALFSEDLKGCLKQGLEEIVNKVPDLKPYGALLDNNFMQNFYTDEECRELSKLIIPIENGDAYEYEDRIAIFIGYDKNIDSKFKLMQPSKFKESIEEYIVDDIKLSIDEFKLSFNIISDVDVTVDCFFVPFESTENFKRIFFESLL